MMQNFINSFDRVNGGKKILLSDQLYDKIEKMGFKYKSHEISNLRLDSMEDLSSVSIDGKNEKY